MKRVAGEKERRGEIDTASYRVRGPEPDLKREVEEGEIRRQEPYRGYRTKGEYCLPGSTSYEAEVSTSSRKCLLTPPLHPGRDLHRQGEERQTGGYKQRRTKMVQSGRGSLSSTREKGGDGRSGVGTKGKCYRLDDSASHEGEATDP